MRDKWAVLQQSAAHLSPEEFRDKVNELRFEEWEEFERLPPSGSMLTGNVTLFWNETLLPREQLEELLNAKLDQAKASLLAKVERRDAERRRESGVGETD